MWEKIKYWRDAGSDLSSTDRREFLEDLFVFGEDGQVPFYKHMAYLLIVSTIIACCGLMADSAAVVIGAMLVAPMMRPVMICAAAITLGWTNYLYQALLLTLVMAIGAVGIAVLFAWLAPELVRIPDQVLARTSPTYFDLIIALAAGSGGAYTMTRHESGAIPGVAMAVALLPPLASTGILLVFVEYELALKAFVLFFTNFASMVLSACLTFLYVGIAPRKTRERAAHMTRNFLLVFFLLVVSISVPLYFYSTEVWYDAIYKAQQSKELQDWLTKNKLLIDDVEIDEKRQVLVLKLLGPNPPLSVESLHAEMDRAYRRKFGAHAPDYSISVLWTQTAHFSWPPELDAPPEERSLARDFSRQLTVPTWYWIGTQYSDGEWLRPDRNNTDVYTLRAADATRVKITTRCVDGVGTYSLSQEEVTLRFETAADESCATAKLDNRFINDLTRVIKIDIERQHMTLRLGGDVGVMHFQHTPPR